MIDFLNKIEPKLKFRDSYYLMFAILNAAILMNFHKLYFRNPLALGLLIGSVVFTILFPKKWYAVFFSCAVTIWILIDVFPRIGNHSTILLFISLGLFLVLFVKLWRKRVVINADFLSYFFRVFTVTAYFYTGFHKLNTDFLNPCVSCVNEINEYTLASIFGFPFQVTDSLSRFFQINALLIECIVPFGILFHKTRKYAIAILLFFHCYLALSVFADFSSVAMFLLIGCLIDFKNFRFSENTFKMLRFYLVFCVLSVMVPFFIRNTTILKSQYDFIKGVMFLIGFGSLIFFFLRNLHVTRNYFQKTYLLPLTTLSLLISLWTLKSYVGLGNAGNLTMFSNLVTEKSMSNHLLIDTKKTKIFDFEEDFVYIVTLDNPYVREKYNGYRMPVAEFRFLVNYWSKNFKKPIPCELIYKDKKYVFEDLKTSEFRETKWWYKYLSFRKIQTNSPNECRW